MTWQKMVSLFKENRDLRKDAKAAARARDQQLSIAIEHVVDEINPKIRAVSGYRKKLNKAVARTLDYCSAIVVRVPGPVEANRKSWNSDPLIKAFFSGTEDLHRVFSRSSEIHDFFETHASAEHCYALLSMECKERSVLGSELHGDVLKRDVRQTTVNFSDHRVVKPAATESQLRKELEQRAFENLVSYALERITALLASRHSLEEQGHLLQMQLKLAEVKRASLAPLMGDEDSEVIDLETLRERQAHTGQALQQARARLNTLDDYIDRITEVLGDPENHLKLGLIAMHLSKLNVKLDDNSAESGNRLELCEGSLGERIKRILLIVRFPRSELLAKEDFLSKAERSLH